MKTNILSVVPVLFLISPAAFAGNYKSTVKSSLLDELRIDCREANGWQFETSVASPENNVEILTIKLSRDQAAVPPAFDIVSAIPQKDIYNLWNSIVERPVLLPNWSTDKYLSQLAQGMPVYEFFNDNNENRLTLALSEPYRSVTLAAGVREKESMISARFSLFLSPEAPIDSYQVSLRIDMRDRFWAETVAVASEWVVKECGIRPLNVPQAAFEPLYSSWYQFHQHVTAKDIEEEAALAAGMGMKTLILDDGWQSDPDRIGYVYSGDWNISTVKFPDMASHVRKVQDMGIKYMMWYAVPFIGLKSENFAKFEGKYLYVSERLKAAILDPRFPEVREFIIGVYEAALKKWNLDGFKLDFIDRFVLPCEDPAIADNYAGRDIRSITEAEDVLMREVASRLKAIKPDILIEFRQKYIGQAIRGYGNMFRATDCPADKNTNRVRIANLRIASGNTAVHGDMLEWNMNESPENASRTIICSIFGVVQYSLMLRDIPQSHRDVIRHWIDFSTQHMNTLLKGGFKPYHPEAGYPLIEAFSEDETIFGLYTENTVVPVSRTVDTYILNATGQENVYINLAVKAVRAVAFDAYGNSTPVKAPGKGVSSVKIPNGGYLKLLF